MLLATLATLAGAGCYTYRGVPIADVRPGTSVRARLSGAEAERLESVIGTTGRYVEGDLVERLDTAYVLAVNLPAASAAGAPATTLQQRIVVSSADLQTLEVRRLDRFRTALLVGGAVAASVAIAVARSNGAGSGPNSGGGPPELRVPAAVPFIRFRIGVGP